MENINVCGYNLNIILPNNYNLNTKYKLLIINDGDMLGSRLRLEFSGIIVGIIPNDRLKEYTPWVSPAIKENAPDFKGEADIYNSLVENSILSYLLKQYNIDSNYIIYGGYSLGGLCAIKSLYTTNVFTHIFSICGSFWFPKFSEFVLTNEVLNKDALVYLINGLNEGIHHNNILSGAPICARTIHTQLTISNNTISIFDEYDHHQFINNRFNEIIKLIDK